MDPSVPILQRAAPSAPPAWVATVVSGWTFLVLAADLKTSIHPAVHWFVTALAVTLLLPYLLRFRVPRTASGLRPARAGLVPAGLLVLAVLLASFASPEPLYGLEQAGKLGIILVAARALFLAQPELAHAARRGFFWAIAINVALLLLGLAGAGTASELGPRRWGTVLNYPGSLARLGVLGLGYAGYMVLAWRRPSRHLLLLAACGTLIYFDGSRTAWLVIAVLVPFLLIARFSETRSGVLPRLANLGFAAAITLALVAGWSWLARQTEAPEGTGAVARAAQLAVNLRLSGAAGLALADPVRARMLETGMEAWRNASPVGTGIGTTIADTEVGLMVVHVTYLQIIGDIGLFGLAAYVCLVLAWVPWVPRAWRNTMTLPIPESRAPYVNAIFLLVAFVFVGLFHPLSTEWTEWIMFLVPFALLREVA